MAGTKESIEKIIQENRQKGLDDNQIFSALSRRRDRIGIDIANAGKDMGSQGIAEYFGLKLQAKDPNEAHKRNISKTQSRLESAAAGLADTGAGIIQGAAWLGDKVNKKANSLLGTNLPTNALESYNKDYQLMNKDIEKGRESSGREGSDLVRMGTEIVSTIPAFAATGGSGAGVKGAGMFAAKQAATGAAVGAARHADNAEERQMNIAGGAIGAGVGGLVGEKVISPIVSKGAGALTRAAANIQGRTAQAATGLVDDALRGSEFDIPDAKKLELYEQATKALKSSNEMNPEAMINQALLEKNGIKGTQAQVNRDPSLWRDEKELAKLNNKLLMAHEGQHNQFDNLMRTAVDETGAAPNNTYAKMDDAFNKLREADELAQSNVSQLYNKARSLSSNDVQLDHLRFIDQASRELEENGVGSFMKGDIKGIFKGMFDDPSFKLTHSKAEEINKVLNARLRSTTDGSERYALGIIKKNLEKEVDATIDDLSHTLGNGPSDGGLVGAKDAWQTARSAAKERFQTIEKTPALKAALDEKNPDKSFKKFVLNSDINDLDSMLGQLKKVPEGDQSIADIQGAVIEHFLDSATKSNSGAVSPHGLNKAIKDFGEDRMNLLFSPEQISHIKEIKKVSDLLFQQPNGAPVNHSNTASALQYLMGLTNLVGRIPVVGRGANLIGGAINTSDDLIKSGKAYGYIDGKPAVTPNSTLGLTEKEKNVIKLAEKLSGGRVTSPVGMVLGEKEANN